MEEERAAETVEFETAYRSGRSRIDPRIFLGAVPALVFLVARQVLSAQAAIAVSFARRRVSSSATPVMA